MDTVSKASKDEYLKLLKSRAKESHVYRRYQLIGLEIATILGDEQHKSLYIKLAKERSPEALLRLAKQIAEKKTIRSKGAFFMSQISQKAKGKSKK